MTTPTPHRTIRSFVRREGRMNEQQKLNMERRWQGVGIDLDVDSGVLDFALLFDADQQTVLEIGFGMGASLLQMAQENPQINYLGIEVHRPGVAKLLAGIEAQQLKNVRIICDDAVQVLKRQIKDASLAGVQIYFPDPWPKKRHHKRRLIQAEFIALICQKLKPQGFIHCATDWQEYAEQMLAVLSQEKQLYNPAGDDGYSPRPEHRPLTKFELRGQRLGHGVWDLLFIKNAMINS